MLGTPLAQYLTGSTTASLLQATGELDLTGEQTFSTTGTTNDLALSPGVSVFRYTGNASATITGFTGGVTGRMLLVINDSSTSSNLALSNNTGSAAANQIVGVGLATTTSNYGGGMLLRYDGTKWRVVSQATATIGATLSVNGTLAVGGAVSVTNTNNPGSLSGTNNDWTPTAAFRQRMAASAAAIITGFASGAGTAGRLNWFQNLSAFSITLSHEGAGSTAANRFTCPRSADLVIPPTGNAFVLYDGTTSRWIVFGDASCWSQGASTLSGDLIAPPMGATRYYYAPAFGTISTSATLGNGNFRACRMYVPNAITVTRMGAEITSAGDAGSKLRLGIYGDDGTGRPGTLVLDAGTIAGDSATVQEITGLSATIGPGWYWFGGAVQLVTVTQPTIRINSVSDAFSTFEASTTGSAPTTGLGSSVGANMSGTTGALPSTFTLAGTAGVAPRIFIKT